MAVVRDRYAHLRRWVAPALGLGLLIAGIAMGAGMATSYAPLVAILIAAAVLAFGQWGWPAYRGRRGGGRPPTPPALP